jgi:hypothetical protein
MPISKKPRKKTSRREVPKKARVTTTSFLDFRTRTLSAALLLGAELEDVAEDGSITHFDRLVLAHRLSSRLKGYDRFESALEEMAVTLTKLRDRFLQNNEWQITETERAQLTHGISACQAIWDLHGVPYLESQYDAMVLEHLRELNSRIRDLESGGTKPLDGNPHSVQN